MSILRIGVSQDSVHDLTLFLLYIKLMIYNIPEAVHSCINYLQMTVYYTEPFSLLVIGIFSNNTLVKWGNGK